MSLNYGIPYKGSKNRLSKPIFDIFNEHKDKKYLIDVFAGGFAVSHYALVKTKMKVISNDLDNNIIDLYKELFFNNCNNLKKVYQDWVCREKYADIRKHPENYENWYRSFVLIAWSFGNAQNAYLYGKNVENIKKIAHDYLIQNGYDFTPEKRNLLMKKFKPHRIALQHLQNIERFCQFYHQVSKHVNRIELYSLNWLDFIESIPKDILEKSIIYCDPPYEDTSQYNHGIDYDEFWKWFLETPYAVYVSSYKSHFDIKPYKSFKVMKLMGDMKKMGYTYENLYYNRKNFFDYF